MLAKVFAGDCLELLSKSSLHDAGIENEVCLSFVDPPFNQGKDYRYFEDDIPSTRYWTWMEDVCGRIRDVSAEGGAIYFMQREKNTEQVLHCLRVTGWTLQNLVIWQKRTSAVPNQRRFGKQYQIIAFATNGKSPRVFHRLRIDAPLRAEYKQQRKEGLFLTDCWDDVREMTSGYLAGDEALRVKTGERFHKQQSPIALLLRILLSSSNPGDLVLDPFAGTGTTLVVAGQLGRPSVGVEIDPSNVELVRWRLNRIREADSVALWSRYYRFTKGLDEIWPATSGSPKGEFQQLALTGE